MKGFFFLLLLVLKVFLFVVMVWILIYWVVLIVFVRFRVLVWGWSDYSKGFELFFLIFVCSFFLYFWVFFRSFGGVGFLLVFFLN